MLRLVVLIRSKYEEFIDGNRYNRERKIRWDVQFYLGNMIRLQLPTTHLFSIRLDILSQLVVQQVGMFE
jgi:hypothetical protein